MKKKVAIGNFSRNKNAIANVIVIVAARGIERG
jgi:hypothetical protein